MSKKSLMSSDRRVLVTSEKQLVESAHGGFCSSGVGKDLDIKCCGSSRNLESDSIKHLEYFFHLNL
jgi:hypothetical protein